MNIEDWVEIESLELASQVTIGAFIAHLMVQG